MALQKLQEKKLSINNRFCILECMLLNYRVRLQSTFIELKINEKFQNLAF